MHTHTLARLLTALLFLPFACSEAEREETDSLPVDSVSLAPDSMPISSPPVLSYDPGCSDDRQYAGGEDPEDFGINPKRYILRDLATGRYHTIELCHGLLLLRDGETTPDTLGTLARKWDWRTYGQSLEVHDSIILANEAIGKGNSQSGDVQFIGIVDGRIRLLAQVGFCGYNPVDFGYYQLTYEVARTPLRISCREEVSGTGPEDGASRKIEGEYRDQILHLDTNEHILYSHRLSLSGIPLYRQGNVTGSKITGTFPGILFFYTPRKVYIGDQWCNLSRRHSGYSEEEAGLWIEQVRYSGEDGWECHCE